MCRLVFLFLVLLAASFLPGCGGGGETQTAGNSADPNAAAQGMPADFGMPDGGAGPGSAGPGSAAAPGGGPGMAMPGDVDAGGGALAAGGGLPGGYPAADGGAGGAGGAFLGGGPPGGYPGAGGSGGAEAGLPGDGLPGTGVAAYPPGYGRVPGGDADAANAAGYGPGFPGGGLPGAGYPGGPGAVPEPPKTLDGKAKLAMRTGREKEALLYYYGHGLASDQGAADIIGSMKWVSGLKQKVNLAVRFGIGVKLVAKQDVRSNLSPIGTSGQGGGGAPGGSFDGAAGYGGGAAGGGNSSLAQYAGELGDILVDELRSRLESEKFGKVLQDAQGSEGGSNQAAGFGGYPGADLGGAGGAGVPGYAPTGDLDGGAAGGRGARGSRRGATLTSIAPGISFLGVGEEKELAEKAKTHGIDAVIIFHVEARATRVGVSNDTKIILLADGKSIASTKELNNIKVSKARTDSKPDGVDGEMKKIVSKIDELLVMSDFPAALTKEAAIRRVSSLAAGKHDNPLLVLAEMKLFHLRELITDDDLVTGFDGLVGAGNGIKLAGGSEEERIKVLEKWLPK